MGVIREIILVVLSILAIIVTTSIVIFMSSSIMLYPSFYEQSFEEANLYEEIEQQFQKLSGIESLTLPKENVETFVNQALVSLLSYIRSDTDEISLILEIDETVVRDSLTAQLAGVPPCVEDIAPYQGIQFVCIPDGKTTIEFVDEYLAQNQILSETRQIDLADTEFLAPGSEALEAINQIRDAVSLLRTLFSVYILVLLLLIGLIVFVEPVPKRNVFVVFGIIILVSATFVIVGGLVLKNIEQEYITLEEEFLQSLVSSAIKQLLHQYFLYGILLFVVGVIVTVFGVMVHKKRKEKKKAATKK